MPLIKGTSKETFAKNVRKEIAAGKEPDQAVAIAYSVKKEAKKAAQGTESHSRHSADRSKHYHDKVVGVFKGPTQMTQARSQTFRDDEDYEE